MNTDFIGGHDYGSDRYIGVEEAVNEMYPDRELGEDLTWWVKL